MEIGRRCATLLTTVAREFEANDVKLVNGNGHGKVRQREEDEDDVDDDPAPAKKKAKNGVKVESTVYVYTGHLADMGILQNKQLDAVKSGSKTTTTQTSRAVSVSSNRSSPAVKGKSKGRK